MVNATAHGSLPPSAQRGRVRGHPQLLCRFDEPGWFFATSATDRASAARRHPGLSDRHSLRRPDPDRGLIRTDLAYEGSSRNSGEGLSPDRCAPPIGWPEVLDSSRSPGREPLSLPHALRARAEPLDEQLAIFERLPRSESGEVVVLFIEPYAEVATSRARSTRRGCSSKRRDRPRRTVADSRRALAGRHAPSDLAENEGARGPGTSMDSPSPGHASGRENSSGAALRRHRGRADSPLFLINHGSRPNRPR